MSLITYRFNAYDSGGDEWSTNPEYMVDGNEDNHASTTSDDDVEALLGNTCDGTNLGTISKVELRAKIYDTGVGHIDLQPIFLGGNGDVQQLPSVSESAWSSWYDITTDTNAPESWDWGDVQDLDCNVIANVTTGTWYCAQIEIQVTYEIQTTLTETIILIDSIEKYWEFNRTFLEMTSLSDSIVYCSVFQQLCDNTITLTDSIFRYWQMFKLLQETQTITDSFSGIYPIGCSESILLVDTINKLVSKTLNEIIQISDAIYFFTEFTATVLSFTQSKNLVNLIIKVPASSKLDLEDALKYAGRVVNFTKPFGGIKSLDTTSFHNNTIHFDIIDCPPGLTNPLTLIISNFTSKIVPGIPYYIFEVSGYKRE